MKQAIVLALLTGAFSSVGGATPILGATDLGLLVSIDATTGLETAIGSFGGGLILSDIAFNSINGALFGINLATPSQFYSINTSTGAASAVGSTTINNLNGLTFSPTGALYASGGGSAGGTVLDGLYTVNTSTGAATLVGVGGGNYRSSGDLEFFNGTLYATGFQSVGNDILYSINTTTGVATPIGTNLGFANVFGLANNNGTLVGFTNPGSGTGQIITINVATGFGTFLTNYTQEFNGATDFTPEPGTLGLFGIGFGAICYYAARRRQASSR